MSRRKQSKPRFVKHVDGICFPDIESNQVGNEEINYQNNEDDIILDEERPVSVLSSSDEKSISSDTFSSPSSSSFTTSFSDGIVTPNSLIHEHEINLSPNGNVEENETARKSNISDGEEKPVRQKDAEAKRNCEGSYHCQFCDKTFPRLGYLKKHEQSHAEHMPFKCEFCARLFKHKRSRDRHTKLHTGDRRYKCPHCEAAFSRSDHLKIHMKTHDNQKPFQCTICNRGYNTAAALTSHMQNHKKQSAFLGNQNFNYSPRSNESSSSVSSSQKRKHPYSDSNLHVSQFSHTNLLKSDNGNGTEFSCVYCTKNDFHSTDQLYCHMQTMHSGLLHSDLRPSNLSPSFFYDCEFCTMKFSTIQVLFHHLKTNHIDRINSPNSYMDYIRQNCLSESMPGLLSSSQTQNSTEKENVNNDLSPSSPTESKADIQDIVKKENEQEIPTDLSQPKHKRVRQSSSKEHEEMKANENFVSAFMCNQCNAGLPDFESFRTHLKSHIQPSLAHFFCQHCGITCNDKHQLEKHIFTHFMLTDSEFCCSASCKKSFTKPDDLQKHLLDNHVQTLFKCTICMDIFDTKVALQVHFAVAHYSEEKIVRCSSCMETFRSDKEFRLHVNARHILSGGIQCLFCQAICATELEMHFHLAAHARQFRCPVCPESFHVEYLLDRHLQSHHSQKDIDFQNVTNNNNILKFQKTEIEKNNQYGFNERQFDVFQMDAMSKKAQFLHGTTNHTEIVNQIYSTNRDSGTDHNHSIYLATRTSLYSDKGPTNPANGSLINQNGGHSLINKNHTYDPLQYPGSGFKNALNEHSKKSTKSSDETKFSCGICERNDFNTETDVHTHRKVTHNLKTGVSLRCAYCNGDFRSRTELENHMKSNHNTSGKHKCLICDDISPSPAVLAEHKLTHCKVGLSGKCSYCMITLTDMASFKSHLNEHNGPEIPVQCICCRQTLNSQFEVTLHAKFHTKESENNCKNTCALCLGTLPSNSTSKICDKCLNKHSFKKISIQKLSVESELEIDECRCNLCKKLCTSALKLQEHLIEHTFAGCEERGFNCYICSSVFTTPSGLQGHIIEHGLNTRPYDCNLCTAKFFFRAELDHHSVEHEIYHQKIEKTANMIDDIKTETVEDKICAKNEPGEICSSKTKTSDNDMKQKIKTEESS